MSADYADLVMASKAGDTVPFEFIAGSITLSAGTYTVTRNSPDTNSNSLLVISDHSHSSLLQPAAFNGSPVDDVCLSFERVDVTYLLSEVKAQLGTYTIAKRPGYCKPAEASQDEATRQHEQFDDNLFWQSIKPIYGSRLPDLLR